MTSPARQHFLRVSAAVASATAVPGQPVDASQYELMLLKLAEDKRRLKQVQSMEAKADVKRELLPDYQPWVDGVLSAGAGAQDAVLMTVMLWKIDAGDYTDALRIADYALRHNLAMPDQYQRPAACTVVEEIADAAKRARDGKAPFDLSVLLRCQEITTDCDMPDQVRAKLHKEIGLLQAETDPASALQNLQRAMQLHGQVGVKKDVERLQRQLNNAAAGG